MTSSFIINGKAYTVNLSTLPADINLNTFIREHAGLPGTKFMCQEGGCGVCTCTVTGKNPATGKVQTWAVNSCLTLLNTCNDWEITTIEGLGSKRNGYHSIQKRLAKMNGTQCGFCSPGFVMNMYGLLESKGGKVTMEEVENSFGGNICRCTGYRPILDAMKSFAVDSNIEVPEECRDIEDLSTKICPKTGNSCLGSCGVVTKRSPIIYTDGSKWYWPKSFDDLFSIFGHLKTDQYMLVSGNTAHGVYRRTSDIKTFIDVNAVPELSQHSITPTALILGANLSLTETMDIFLLAAKQRGFEYCRQLWNHFDLIANVPIRNTGSLAGNLTIKHEHKEFPSDIFIVFEALDVKVVINESATAQKTLSIEEYLRTPMKKKVIRSFVLPQYPSENYIFDSYKIMPRAQNAHAYVNAAFLVNIERPSMKVKSACICFGGINPDFTHAKTIEDSLRGQKLFDPQVTAKVFAVAKNQLKAVAALPDASPEYRQKLALGLFYKFLLKHTPNALPDKLRSGGQLLKRPVSSGKRMFERTDGSFPIYEPTEKYEGLLQVAGEATFANDVPLHPKQLWAAFVTAKKVGATVTTVDVSEAMKIPGVVAYFSAQDIPGRNGFTSFDPVEEEIFATGTIKFYNHPIGVLVAESNSVVNEAANLVKITYEGGTAKVLPTMEDVLNTASSNRIEHKIKSPIEELKLEEKYDVRGSGKLDMGLQYHFFLEPHTTVVIPFEGGLEVHSSTQWMDLLQNTLAQFFNMKSNEIQCKVHRLGGGYGGKATRNIPSAAAAALAAYKLNRPVRFVQSLESIMNTTGKRWAFHSNYDFYAKQSGKIVALRSAFYEDAGYLPSESPLGHTVLLGKNMYEFNNNYKLDGYIVISDSPTNTACRAPGSLEGIAMIENMIEHIAFEACLDPVDVRLANLTPGHKMWEMLPRFIETTKYKQRKQEVNGFNEQNRWRKRGLGMTIMEYHMAYFGQYTATVAVYHGDGTVMISHGGIEMGQGMNTKVAQLAAHILGIPQTMIRFECSNTMNGANSMVTGGSIGSEALCYAVRNCCNTLNERLKPVREAMKDPSWEKLVEKAYGEHINLIASDYTKPDDMKPYTVCALGLTEVEVDLLTGNYLVTRVDILEDVGESLNPSVDIGQIEGAFIMGLGYWTTEQIVVDSVSGELKTNRTWNYKPPGAKDVPIDFRIELLPRSQNTGGFMRSKATGEPAICLPVSVAFALQQALQSARSDAGLKKSWVPLRAPMTPEYVLLNSGTEVNMMKLN